MDVRQEAIKEMAIREILKRNQDKHDSLFCYLQTMYEKEMKKEYNNWWVYKKICSALEKVANWEIKRLIINISPRLWKSDAVTKWFTTWLIWKKPKTKFIVTWYSASLMERFSWEARNWYLSDTYKTIFPRRPELRDDENQKRWWTNKEWWSYYAVWAWWTITGVGADYIIIDDPINPKDENSNVIRTWVNNWFHNVLESRLDDKTNWAIVIVMQRVHWDDLCWHLIELESQGLWEKWDKLIIPAIAEHDEEFRKEWESINEDRLPISFLKNVQEKDKVMFSCQYQQQPFDKESQEFHQEWFKYFDDIPSWWGRIFTCVDPAFTKNATSDDSAIITGMFIKDSLYILEMTSWKYNPWELIDKMIYHIQKWNPEKIWIEAYQAQSIIWFSLNLELQKRNIYCTVEDMTQSWDKESKIRRLQPLYRSWLIYHRRDMIKLEKQLLEFPRGKHDDEVDVLQMLYDMYTLQPNTIKKYEMPRIEYDHSWRPIFK